jgi:hypothetical protein
MCIQVIEAVLWFLCMNAYYAHVHTRQIAYELLVCTCAYHLDERLPGCSSVFHIFFAGFPRT